MSRGEPGINDNQRIDSWKEIAAFFGRDERTVRRWERYRSLPVHRVPGSSKSGVFAYAEELREWLHSAEQVTSEAVEAGDEAKLDLPAASATAISATAVSVTAGPATAASAAESAPAVAQAVSQAAIPMLDRTHFPRVPILEMPRGNMLFPVFRPIRSDDSIPQLATPGERRIRPGTVKDRRVPANRRLLWAAACGLAVLALVLSVRQMGRARPDTLATVNPGAGPSRVRDPQSEDFYLRGRYYWNRRTADSLNQAVDAFTQAIVHDPADAEAYAGLADTYDLMPEYAGMPDPEAYSRAIAAATKAVALDGSLSEAHRALAFGLFYGNWEIARALGEYRRAISLNPADVEAHHWYATSLLALGRYKESMAEIERARQLEPGSKSILADRDLLVYLMGDRSKAMADLLDLERGEPGFLSPPRYLARFYLLEGDCTAFILQSRKAAAISRDAQEAAQAEELARSFAGGGRRAMLEDLRRMQQKAFASGHSSGYALAETDMMLGDKEQALPLLRNALAAHDSSMLSVDRQEMFSAPFKGDPRFHELTALLQSRIAGVPGDLASAGGPPPHGPI